MRRRKLAERSVKSPAPGHLRCRAEELVAPYYVFSNAGYDVTLASIKGGEIPVDEASLQGRFKSGSRGGCEPT